MLNKVSAQPQAASLDENAWLLNNAKSANQVEAQPTLAEFTAAVKNGNARQVVGVYVPGELALPIVQQPSGSPAYVPNQPGVAAQFGMAAEYNTIALLAHNTLAGAQFGGLEANEEVVVIYGDGRQEKYIITELAHYQALSPHSPYSNFVDLDSPDKRTLTAEQVFNHIYTNGKRVVFQTCIRSGNESSWGRLFVSAIPAPKDTRTAYRHYEQYYSRGSFSSLAWAD